MPVQPLPWWHRTSKFLLRGHGLKIPQPRSTAALPPSTEEAGSPLAPQPSANSRHSHRFAPTISGGGRSQCRGYLTGSTIKSGVTRTRAKPRMSEEREHEEDRACDRRLDASAGASAPEGGG